MTRGWLIVAIAVIGCTGLTMPRIGAAAITMAAASGHAGPVHFEALRLTVHPATDGASARLDLSLDRLAVDATGYVFRDLRWRCALQDADAARWQCDGPISARHGGERVRATLRLSSDGDASSLRLARDAARVTVRVASDEVPALALEAVPFEWLGGLVAPLVPDMTLGTGRLAGGIRLVDTARPAIEGELALDDGSFDSLDGLRAGAGLGVDVSVRLAGTPAGWEGELGTTWRGGELLLTPAYVRLPATPVEAGAAFRSDAEGWTFTRWRWRDPAALVAEGAARLASDGTVRSFDVSAFDLTLPAGHGRYAEPVLATAGLGGLRTSGRITGRFRWRDGEPVHWRADLERVGIDDPAARFAVAGLDGSVHDDSADPAPSHLTWDALSLYRIAVAGGDVRLILDRGALRLVAPLRLEMLGGAVEIPAFERVPSAEGPARVTTSIAVDRLDVAALSAAFGWPRFGGTLSGRIPAVRSDGDALRADGALEIDVFNGRIRVAGLALERAFGVAPSLAADVTMDDLDLALLTEAFDFGRIEGRMDGRIGGLRLVDWQPVAFDLVLRSDDAWEGRRRISQRAVNALSSVGGGVAAGLQASVLKVFESFPYAAIGIRCRLENNVCTMGGIDSETTGYTIVQGSGLPRLTVKGFQQRVDWPVLLARLKAATAGAGPVIE